MPPSAPCNVPHVPFAVFTLDVRLLHIFKARKKPIFPSPSLIPRSDKDLVRFQTFARCGTGLAKNTTTSRLWGNIRIASDPSTGVSNVENRREHIPVHNFFRGECRVLHVCPVDGAHHKLLAVSHTRRPGFRPVGYTPITQWSGHPTYWNCYDRSSGKE
jgi:hypothetical protein